MNACVREKRERERERSMRERKKGKTIFRYHHCALWIEYQRGVVDCSQLVFLYGTASTADAVDMHA